MLLAALILACLPSAPATAGDCDVLFATAKQKQACFAAAAVPIFRADPAKGEAFITEEITDPLQRDFAWLQVTEKVTGSDVYCARIENADFQRQCRERGQRPHLNKELGHSAMPKDAPKP